MTSLADGTLFLATAQSVDNQLSYGRIDRDGKIVAGPATLSASNPRNPDAVQLPNGNIVLAWSNWSGSKSSIAYAVLNSGLGIVKGLTSLPNSLAEERRLCLGDSKQGKGCAHLAQQFRCI